jgi:hypothetical protein
MDAALVSLPPPPPPIRINPLLQGYAPPDPVGLCRLNQVDT